MELHPLINKFGYFAFTGNFVSRNVSLAYQTTIVASKIPLEHDKANSQHFPQTPDPKKLSIRGLELFVFAVLYEFKF